MRSIRRFTAVLLGLTAIGGIPLVPDSPAQAATLDNSPWVLPTRPPRCTSTQINSGAVANCLVSGYSEADAAGWPTPPFPSDAASGSEVGVVPLAGWIFNGQYNGSPALADWEAQLISNQTAVGPLRAGRLKALPDTLPLFAGFIRDISAGGYKVLDAGMYSFRCTSGSGKSCQGLTRNSLSNHSWGLAMDMNSGANPEATYVGIDGASACQTPMKTDLPKWVIETAEKWGLYWGGYGWSGGCSSPSEMKTSATRDATHFEFRGSPAQARAIAAANLGGACISVADEAGTIGPRCLSPGDAPGPGWRVVVSTKAPAGTTAALVNLTITGALAAGYITAETCAAAPAGPRASSNGNVVVGQTVANLAVVPLDSTGRFCLYRSQAMHTIVDVQGYFAPASTAGSAGTLFAPVGPQRVMDTRADPAGPVPAGAETTVSAAMVPATAVAMLANLTLTDTAEAGYLTADACPTLTPGPQTHSNANFAANETVANLAVIPVTAAAGGPQFCTYSTAQAQKIVDVQGYFAPPTTTGWGYTAQTAKRLVDTRGCWTDPVSGTLRCAQLLEANSIVRLKAPAGAAGVLLNLTLTGALADGFAAALPCSLAIGPSQQSSSNVAAGGTAANLAVVAVDPDGSFCVSVSAPMHVVVDLQGTFAPGGGLRFTPITPVRRNDSRFGLS